MNLHSWKAEKKAKKRISDLLQIRLFVWVMKEICRVKKKGDQLEKHYIVKAIWSFF